MDRALLLLCFYKYRVCTFTNSDGNVDKNWRSNGNELARSVEEMMVAIEVKERKGGENGQKTKERRCFGLTLKYFVIFWDFM